MLHKKLWFFVCVFSIHAEAWKDSFYGLQYYEHDALFFEKGQDTLSKELLAQIFPMVFIQEVAELKFYGILDEQRLKDLSIKGVVGNTMKFEPKRLFEQGTSMTLVAKHSHFSGSKVSFEHFSEQGTSMTPVAKHSLFPDCPTSDVNTPVRELFSSHNCSNLPDEIVSTRRKYNKDSKELSEYSLTPINKTGVIGLACTPKKDRKQAEADLQIGLLNYELSSSFVECLGVVKLSKKYSYEFSKSEANSALFRDIFNLYYCNQEPYWWINAAFKDEVDVHGSVRTVRKIVLDKEIVYKQSDVLLSIQVEQSGDERIANACKKQGGKSVSSQTQITAYNLNDLLLIYYANNCNGNLTRDQFLQQMPCHILNSIESEIKEDKNNFQSYYVMQLHANLALLSCNFSCNEKVVREIIKEYCDKDSDSDRLVSYMLLQLCYADYKQCNYFFNAFCQASYSQYVQHCVRYWPAIETYLVELLINYGIEQTNLSFCEVSNSETLPHSNILSIYKFKFNTRNEYGCRSIFWNSLKLKKRDILTMPFLHVDSLDDSESP